MAKKEREDLRRVAKIKIMKFGVSEIIQLLLVGLAFVLGYFFGENF